MMVLAQSDPISRMVIRLYFEGNKVRSIHKSKTCNLRQNDSQPASGTLAIIDLEDLAAESR